MADFEFNIAKGRTIELVNRVDSNDPAAACLYIIPIDAGAISDAVYKDCDDFAAVIAAGATERSSSGWNRKTLTDADIALAAPDDASDGRAADFADPQWTPTAGAVTDLVVCYSAVASPTDSQLVPLTMHDFAITPDGSVVTGNVNAGGFYLAT